MTKEITRTGWSGWMMIVAHAAIAFASYQARGADYGIFTVIGLLICVGMLAGYSVVNPNESLVLTMFGTYYGSIKNNGFFWLNPLVTKRKLSLRTANFETTRLKVNDKQGNPIEIAAVVVWKVTNTAQACFDVQNYDSYVHIQAETAIRELASHYAYDNDEHNGVTLRSATDEVTHKLHSELQSRLQKAGVLVEEARITHLAYAQEIASVMLRRQQAEAVVSARGKIVQGAVGMVKMVVHEMEKDNFIKMNDAQRATLASNLMVVLCGETDVHPVINTGN